MYLFEAALALAAAFMLGVCLRWGCGRRQRRIHDAKNEHQQSDAGRVPKLPFEEPTGGPWPCLLGSPAYHPAESVATTVESATSSTSSQVTASDQITAAPSTTSDAHLACIALASPVAAASRTSACTTVRNPVTSVARPPRAPKPSSPVAAPQLLPTPPPSGGTGLRAIRRTVSAPDRSRAASACDDSSDGDSTASSSGPVSVLARAAQYEGMCRSVETSPLSSPPASRASSARRLFAAPISPASSCCGSSCASTASSRASGSPISSRRSSPRTSGTGEGEGEGIAAWGCSRSGSFKEYGASPAVSFLAMARASQQERVVLSPLPRDASPSAPSASSLPSSPSKRLMKPNMPSIAGL